MIDQLLHGVRAQLSRVRRGIRGEVDRFRVVTIQAGPAAGMRIGLRHASNDYRSGAIEVPVQEALESLLQPGDVFFDVGANAGFFTLVASRLVGSEGAVVAFEARPDVARTAEKNFRRNGVTAVVLPVAVGDADGTATLLVADHPGGSTIEPSKAVVTERTEVVQQVTIDHVVETGRVVVPTLVKIDVEGAEPAVIRGMSDTLERHRPTLLVELDDADEDTVERQFQEIGMMLTGFGYRCERLAPSYADSGWSVVHFVARPDSGPGR